MLLPEDQRENTLETATDELYRRCVRTQDVAVVMTQLTWGVITVFLKEQQLFALPTSRWHSVLKGCSGAAVGIATLVGIIAAGPQLFRLATSLQSGFLLAVAVVLAGGLGWLATETGHHRK